MPLDRRAFLASAGLTVLAGCQDLLSGDDSTPESTEQRPTRAAPSTDADGTAAAGESATPLPIETTRPIEAPEPVVPVADELLPLPMAAEELEERVRSSGASKDDIPSIDGPEFVSAGEAATFLDDGDIVFGLERNGVVKAYPQRILVYHEVCNDRVGDEPVSVTYCPLTGTAMGFERAKASFGVSGRLLNSNLVLYDRLNETWWPQMLATAIPGPWNERPRTNSLRELRLVWTTWGQWREYRPDTQVLSTETGYVRNYGNDPYGGYNPKRGYYEGFSTLYPKLATSDRFQDKRVVIGARDPDGAVAFLKDALREKGALLGALGDSRVVAVYDSRLDTAYVYRHPVGDPITVADATVTLDGSTYAPDALPLERVYAFDVMWFAWYGFYPDTTVFE